MSIYSVDTLIKETRRIASEYRKTTGKTLAVTPEIALHDAISLLEMTPAEKDDAHDAYLDYDNKQLRVLIKGRAIFDEKLKGQRIGQLKLEQEWDAVVLVIMDDEFMPQEIYLVQRDTFLEQLGEKQSVSKKGAMTIAKFKLIGELIWTQRDGRLAAQTWSNQPS